MAALRKDLCRVREVDQVVADTQWLERRQALLSSSRRIIEGAGILLAVARIAGETAPLLFTALSNQFWSLNLNEPMANLPVTIFKFAMSPFKEWQQIAWAGVFLITLGVLGLNIVARILFRQKHKN